MNYRIYLITLCLCMSHSLTASPFMRAGITAMGVSTATTGLYLMAKDDNSIFRSLINSVKGLLLFAIGGGVVIAEPLVYAFAATFLSTKQKEMPELFGNIDAHIQPSHKVSADRQKRENNYSIDEPTIAVNAACE